MADELTGITADGREVVAGAVRNGRYGACHLNVSGNKERMVLEFDWRPALAPGGKVAFDQKSVGERGSYGACPDRCPSKFVSHGHAWRVDASVDGRRAVIDTMVARFTDAGADQFASDILAIDLKTGELRAIARSRTGASHHSRRQPALSPAVSFIFINEADHCQKATAPVTIQILL